jgi:hypothetical protein
MKVVLTTCPDIVQSRKLLDYCAARGVTKFTVNFIYAGDDRTVADLFVSQFKPFVGGSSTLEQTVYLRKRFQQRPFYLFTPQAQELILSLCGESLLSYEILRYPEDWTFYREEELFFAVVSHEQHAFFQLSESDYSHFVSLDIAHTLSPNT